MPQFEYSLSEQRPELFNRCQLPSTSPIPVSYEGSLICEASIPIDGNILFDLPRDLIEKFSSGKVMVMIDSTSLLPHDAIDDFQMVKITAIEFYDRN